MPSTLNNGGSPQGLFPPHPILDAGTEWPGLSDEQLRGLAAQPDGETLIADYVAGRNERIARSVSDPLRYGFELPHWPELRHWLEQREEIIVFGGNGSAKTEFGGKVTAETLISKHGVKFLGVARSDDDSKQYQQSSVYRYLPVAARNWNNQARKRRSTITKINYSTAGGFTEGVFVLPNRSQGYFKTVAEYLRDPYAFEGPEYDLVWIDEGAPLGLVDTLRVRVGKRAGKLLFTFTAVHGFDAFCANVLDGARILRTLPMNYDWQLGGPNPDMTFPHLDMKEVQVKGCPPGHMPYVMQPLDFNKIVVFMFTHWNPFLPRGKWNPKLPAVFDKCVGRAKWQVRVRLFGYVEKMTGAAISNFNPQVHVIPHARIEALLKAKQLTTYMAADPANRSYFLQWLGIDGAGQMYIFDESPRVEEGEWVDANGECGDGQKVYAGMGVNWYKRHIREREREHGIEAERRFGDPRAFATAVAAEEGGINLFELFNRDGDGVEEDPDVAAMYFEPARIRQTPKADIEVIVDKLAYNHDQEITPDNQPRLFVSDRCANTIRCWLNWNGRPNGEGGKPNPYKDGVDTSRYLFAQETPYMDPSIPVMVGGGGWG